MQSSSSVISVSPSFTGYSSNKLAEIAARVIEELRISGGDEADFVKEDEKLAVIKPYEVEKDTIGGDDEVEVEEEEFEFAVVTTDMAGSSPISADEIFYNGQIRPVYPVFNTDLLLGADSVMDDYHEMGKENVVVTENSCCDNDNSEEKKSVKAETKKVRAPLRSLFMEERESSSICRSVESSCSSSEADDELDGVPEGTYCVWTPRAAAEVVVGKSSSTGSSKRWKLINLKDLLNRSNSDNTGGGKDNFSSNARTHRTNNNTLVFPGPPARSQSMIKKTEEEKANDVAAVEKSGGGEKRRSSLLPHRRQEFVGTFFANVNGLSRNVQPF